MPRSSTVLNGLFYVRFMDDVLVLSPTRWKLRRAVRALNQVLGSLRLEKHPDKTFIGRIERGFDFLGYHFSPKGLAVAEKTLCQFFEKASRLYEQERDSSDRRPLEMYVKRWLRWLGGGLRVAPRVPYYTSVMKTGAAARPSPADPPAHPRRG